MIIVFFVNGKGKRSLKLSLKFKVCKFKVNNKNVDFPSQFCLEGIYNKFSPNDSREVSLKENVDGFSVDCNTINRSDILSSHKYLMVKINI